MLSEGRVLLAHDSRELAEQLAAAGVGVDDTHCADWRGGEPAPLVGQVIALKVEMRRLATVADGMEGTRTHEEKEKENN